MIYKKNTFLYLFRFFFCIVINNNVLKIFFKFILETARQTHFLKYIVFDFCLMSENQKWR